ncbi:MAG TPA: hypothetical protein ENI57_00120 [Ignavibacteria bacterium]|nr:hypothetical protein [Ignavibacteria bacterium]
MQLFRDQNDPNDVIVIMRIENMENAKKIISVPSAYKAKDESGVIDEPVYSFLDKVQEIIL